MPKKTSNYDYFLVQGGSMLPTIKPNQKAKIIKTNDVKIGDIIVFRSAMQVKDKKSIRRIIHRVVKIDKDNIITKGDNRIICDFPITHKEILGKVIKVGNKRIDTRYYDSINPFLAKISYLNTSSLLFPKLTKKLIKGYNKLYQIKKRYIGGERLYLWFIIDFFEYLPNKIKYPIFRLLTK